MFNQYTIFRIISVASIALCVDIIPCYGQPPMIVKKKDSVMAVTSSKYEHPGILMRLAMGNNYRKDWAEPVKMPVFDIGSEQGGLTITKLGGGKQTKSLRMIASDSTEWVLRTADKNVRKVIPPMFRNTIGEKIAQDMVSASYPYGCLIATALSKATGVAAPGSKLVFVPDDTAFGQYKSDFANEVCFFEERNPLRQGTKPESMEDLLEAIQRENDRMILQKDMLRARLLDMLMGDWDRHQGQWRWGKYDSANRTWYYPIAADRDQAFFRPKGVLTFLSNSTLTPFFKGFKRKMNGLYQLNKPARNVDRFFLNQLSEAQWIEIIKEMNEQLTDTVIVDAVGHLPHEIAESRKDKLVKTLQRRRNGMEKAAIKYYRRLSRDAYVFSSWKPELFKISTVDNGTRIVVYSSASPDSSYKIFDRTFDKNYTRRIYIVGIDEKDSIDLPGASNPIKIIVAQSTGGDRLDIRRKMLDRLRALEHGK